MKADQTEKKWGVLMAVGMATEWAEIINKRIGYCFSRKFMTQTNERMKVLPLL